MEDDNTPTVTARRRKKSGHMRLRLETAKKLRALGAKRKATAEKAKADKVTVRPANEPEKAGKASDTDPAAVQARAPKVKKASLATPATPKAKFRKRQVHKSWLPTHLFHAKRARMTPPKEPLWRFAIPLTPTAKSYRPTHRAANERGAVCWDMSYISTISLHGREDSIASVLKGLGVGESDASVWAQKGAKWREGKRAMEALMHEREEPCLPIAPVTVLWRAPSADDVTEKQKRQALLRVHPSAFFQLWEEVLRLAKIAKPAVMVEDLRFELGSIEVTGPASTEALLSALWPSPPAEEGGAHAEGSSEHTFTHLAGLSNPAMLPAGALLAFDVQDPRLHHPPRPPKEPTPPDAQMKLLELIATWPPNAVNHPAGIFDRKSRLSASSSLPSQKAINRRRALAPPGQYPDPIPKDPRIPVCLYVLPPSQQSRTSQQLTYHLLMPWKCIQPVWYSLMYTPLSTGQQPKFGGLDEQRQIAFERGEPWFPADFPGTKAGWEWEVGESKRRREEWERRPKSKRTSFAAVDLGVGKKGEVGEGWSCDWTRLIDGPPAPAAEAEKSDTAGDKDGEANTTTTRKHPTSIEKAVEKPTPRPPQPMPPGLMHLPSHTAHALLASPDLKPQPHHNALLPIRLSLLTRGLATPCARIYRLSTISPDLRKAWLALHPSSHAPSKRRHALPAPLPKDAPRDIVRQRLAASLLEPPRAGEESYPACPGEEDLIGFVTSGNFDLGAGKGTGVGCVLWARVREELVKDGERGRLCVVRNVGMGVGRLARWDVV